MEPAGGFGAHPRTAGDVIELLVEAVPPSVHEHDVERAQITRQPPPEVSGRERLAVSAVACIDHDARRVEPLERELIDRPGWLTADPRVVVPRCVDVSGVVGAEAEERLGRPPLAVPEELRGNPEKRLDRLRAGGVVLEGDLSRSTSGSSGGSGRIGAERSISGI